MYAVFATGGKQYRATTGDIIEVEKIDAEKGATVEIDQVLMMGEGEDVQVGTPYLEGGVVKAKVVEQGRGDKIKVIKFKRRKNYLKRQGHRQYFTALEITDIVAPGGKAKAAPKAEEAEPAEKKAEGKKTASKKKTAKKAAAKKTATKKAASKKTTAKKAAGETASKKADTDKSKGEG